MLASDILREEVAPRTPARHAIRVALLVVTVAFLVAAILAWGVGPVRLGARGGFVWALATAALACGAAVTRLSYARRAWMAVAAGMLPLILGATGFGPLARLGGDGAGSGLATVAMATLLPAALVFRARYRAFRAARFILGGGLLISLPAVALLAFRVLDPGAGPADRGIAAAGIAAAIASTLGFMGAETSAGCAQWAALVVGGAVARPAWSAVLAAWSGRDGDVVPLSAAAVGELMAATLVTFALFQLLAAALARQAREVDVHCAIGAGASDPRALRPGGGAGVVDREPREND